MKKKLYPGYPRTARALKIAEIAQKKSAVVLTKDKESCLELIGDLRFFLTSEDIHEYPAWDPLPFEPVSPQIYFTSKRLHILSRLLSESPQIIVTTPAALLHKVPGENFFSDKTLHLKSGSQTSREIVEAALENAGFTRVRIVEEIGQYALRGSIIDFFTASERLPVRTSFHAETLTGLQFFQPESQRTCAELQSVCVEPVRELWKEHQDRTSILAALKTRGKDLETPARELAGVVHSWRTNTPYSGIELHQYIASHAFTDFFFISPQRATVHT